LVIPSAWPIWVHDLPAVRQKGHEVLDLVFDTRRRVCEHDEQHERIDGTLRE